jgi:FkbH-like protein
MTDPFEYPFDITALTRKRRALRAELLEAPTSIEARVALLGGSTTSELKDFLELFLLRAGIRPTFYECQYNKYEEAVLHDDAELRQFVPRIAVLYTTHVNARLPPAFATEAGVEACLDAEMARFTAIWRKLIDDMGCMVIQNNFDTPLERSLGNLDAMSNHGRAHFLARLNARFAEAARNTTRLAINDIAYQSAIVGLQRWHERRNWYNYKFAVTSEGAVTVAHGVAALIQATFGKTRKCLVLDLDNTLWGGVIGDDGVDGLRLGNETPEGEAYIAIQRYCLELRQRGVLLAVCSKNDPKIAQEGFSHRDSVLKLEDFCAFKASWGPKPRAIADIALELNIGLDSMVFLDDNPVEREIVRTHLPEVAVPDVGTDPSCFIDILDRQLYFETLDISSEDLKRTDFYASNVKRNLVQANFGDYGEFLDSLEMKAEIGHFIPTYMDRILQLTNKTNQFNLTTRRYTAAEMEGVRVSSNYIGVYGRLADKFGDNGLVTVVIGRVNGVELDLDLWIMSCRVLKRDLEAAVLDELVLQARALGLRSIRGLYIRTAKNSMVEGHYESLGFTPLLRDEKRGEWRLDLETYKPKNTHIKEVNRG